MSNFGAYGDLSSLFTKLKQRLALRPKTFTGTQDEWDELTVADRQEYEIVNITDDYTPSAGGGHKIEDAEGTELTQRDTLQVGGSLIAEDDPVNEKTIITNGRQTIEYDDWMELTPQEQAAIPEAVIINAPDAVGGVSNMRYNEDTDCIQIYYDGQWYDTVFVGMKAYYIFKPNVGLLCNFAKGEYTYVENQSNYFRIYPSNGSQFQWVGFSEDLSSYIGLNKKIHIKYKLSRADADSNLGVCSGSNYTSITINRSLHALVPTTVPIEVDFPLDEIVSGTKKYIGICFYDGSSKEFYLYDLCITD